MKNILFTRKYRYLRMSLWINNKYSRFYYFKILRLYEKIHSTASFWKYVIYYLLTAEYNFMIFSELLTYNV